MVECANCGRKVKPTKKFSWLLFILFLFLLGMPALLYLIYYWTKSSTRCPVCGGNVYR